MNSDMENIINDIISNEYLDNIANSSKLNKLGFIVCIFMGLSIIICYFRLILKME